MGFMTREFPLVGFVQVYCLYFVFFVYLPKESRWKLFRKEKETKIYSFYLKKNLKMATFFYCFAYRHL